MQPLQSSRDSSNEDNMQESENMLKVSVVWRGNKYDLEMNSSASLKELGSELQKLTDIDAETMRLIVPHSSNKGSKLFSPFSDEHSCLTLRDTSFLEGKSIRMMGVPIYEVDKVLQDARTDLRIAGFDEEERRLRERRSNRLQASIKLPQGPYIFCDFRTLQIPGLELHPPASEALKRMHMLAADPGIVSIMNKHRWRVGIMTEMAPVGYVGVSPKCILGFNKNQGEEISLRLRTDDLKGFRKYDGIKKTLLHELAHMVYSEHDAKFYALDKKLNEEAASLDWTKSTGHTLSGTMRTEMYEDDYPYESNQNYSQKLGGSKSDQQASARAAAVAAAHRRLAISSDNDGSVSELHDKLDLDESGISICDEPNYENLEGPQSLKISRGKTDYEPDPDDHSGYQRWSEPSPDDSEPTDNQIRYEPDPDDSEVNGLDDSGALLKTSDVSKNEHFPEVKVLDKRFQPDTAADEPDPDDNTEEEVKNMRRLNMEMERSDEGNTIIIEMKKDQAHLSKAHIEPDTNESQPQSNARREPDPDDALVKPVEVSSMEVDEPDLDDQALRRIQDSVTIVCNRLQKAIEMLRAEANPSEATTVLQTIFKIIRNVIEHPTEAKFKRLRKANPVIQRNIINYKAAMEILFVIGFIEDISYEIGKPEPYLVLKRNDPALLWLAKSSLEASIA